MLLPGKAGGTVAVRRTLASTICRIIDPTQVPRLRQLRDASTVMRFQPAHQSMINRRFDDRASCPARKSTRLNSSHANISYAVFCLKKKNENGPVTATSP